MENDDILDEISRDYAFCVKLRALDRVLTGFMTFLKDGVKVHVRIAATVSISRCFKC